MKYSEDKYKICPFQRSTFLVSPCLIICMRFYFFSFLIYSIIYLYQYGLMYIYFVFWVIIEYYTTYFFAQTFQYLTTGSFSVWVLYPFDTHPSFCFLNSSLLSDTTRCPRIILYFPCPDPTISHFSKKPWLILLENGIQKPRSECWMCILLIRFHYF